MDGIPWNKKFGISSEDPAETSGAGNDEKADAAVSVIKIHVADTAKAVACKDIDDLFLP